MEVESTDSTFGDNNTVEKIAALIGDGAKPADPVEKKEVKPEAEIAADGDKNAERSEKPKVSDKDPELLFDPAERSEKSDDNDGEIREDQVTLRDLAENMDVDAKELYDVVIPLRGTGTATLGELKDAYEKSADFDTRSADFETRKTHQENELMTARREIEQLVRLGNQNGLITPELRGELERVHVANMNREHASLLRIIPEWKDPQVRKTEFDQIVEVMAEYGFSRQEIVNAPEHRTVKFMHDMTKRIMRVRKAITDRETTLKKDIPTDTGKSKRGQTIKKGALQQRISDAKAGSRQQRESVISELVNA